MKRIKYNFCLITILLIVSLVFTFNSSLRLGSTIFTMNDARNDDFGAKNIKYPTNMKDKSGIFDITRFSVKNIKDEISFEYNLNNIDNEFQNKNGFSNVLIDTYINVGDEGLLTTLEYGAAVTFNENYPWFYHLRITPEEYYVEKVIDKVNRETERLDCVLEVKENKIKLRVNKNDIKEDLKKSKFYVFTGGYDVFGPDNYRKVTGEEDEWDFYGGIKSLYQPNVIDVVSPVQKKMLSYFVPPVYAVLSPVYNQTHQLLFKKELIYTLIFIFFGYEYYNLFNQYKEEKYKKENEKDKNKKDA